MKENCHFITTTDDQLLRAHLHTSCTSATKLSNIANLRLK